MASPRQAMPAHGLPAPVAPATTAFESVTVAPAAMYTLWLPLKLPWIVTPSAAVMSQFLASRTERSPFHGQIVRRSSPSGTSNSPAPSVTETAEPRLPAPIGSA